MFHSVCVSLLMSDLTQLFAFWIYSYIEARCYFAVKLFLFLETAKDLQQMEADL